MLGVIDPIDVAVTLTGVGRSAWSPFEARSWASETPFSGVICRVENEWMGTMLITDIGGQPTQQLVRGMPKLGYPYVGEDRTFALPMGAEGLSEVVWHAKLDGTNICAFPLRDPADPARVLEVSYKTRLRPSVEAGKFGDFRSLLRAVLDHERVSRAVVASGGNLAFELWGAANPHQIRYERALGLTLHTGVLPRSLMPPRRLDDIAQEHGLERPEVIARVQAAELTAGGVEATYLRLREQFEAANQRAAKRHGEGTFETEGAIMALVVGESAVYLKCKPPTIEEIHFMQARKLSREVVEQALMKLEENGYDLEAGSSALVETLCLEWDPAVVALYDDLVRDVWSERRAQLRFFEECAAALDAAAPDPNDLRACMRALAAHFQGNKQVMSKAFGGYERWKARKAVAA